MIDASDGIHLASAIPISSGFASVIGLCRLLSNRCWPLVHFCFGRRDVCMEPRPSEKLQSHQLNFKLQVEIWATSQQLDWVYSSTCGTILVLLAVVIVQQQARCLGKDAEATGHSR